MDSQETKICSKCNIPKPIGEFYLVGDGTQCRRGDCRGCVKSIRKKYFKDNIEAISIRCKKYYSNNKNKVNNQNKIYRSKNYPSVKAYIKKWKKENPDKSRAIQKRYRDKNVDRFNTKAVIYRKRYKEKHPEKILEVQRLWEKENRHKRVEYTAKRRLATKQQMPKWADRKAIHKFYQEARRLTKETGISHTVDHIIPLRGKNICGLHVENNLQILTRVDNSRKHNKFISGK